MRLLIFAILIVATFSCRKNSGSTNMPSDPSKFTRVQGKNLVDSNGNTVVLRGVAFGNWVWSNNDIPVGHHNETDFIRLKEMHMNAVRFYLKYNTFENDNAPYQYKTSGWEWLDQNVQWAKQHGIQLILNMHAPQGGYQSQGTGDALWNVPENQKRLIALWTEIAKRYKNETAIAGYGLVNEPIPVQSLQQWQQLAQQITNAIRKEDNNHIVFIEKPIYIKSSPPEDANLNFPIVNDNNLVYEFHFYDPHAFTHQLFDWANTGDGGKYPDESIISLSNGSWYTATFNNPKIAAGNSNWTYFEGEKYKITDTKIKTALPALVAAGVQGTVYFDDLVIKEFDESGNFTGNILEMNLNNRDGWNYWSSNNTGTPAVSTTTGVNDNTSLSISAGSGDCNMSNYTKMFVPKPNYSYQICGWMKGENVAQSANCMLRIDFMTSEEPVYARNKEYLRSILKKYSDFSQTKNVPVYVGEFGAGSPCFQNDKGGAIWVSDMLDLISEYNMHFTYHSYHETSFGLYYGESGLPDPTNANIELIELFKQKLD